LVTGVDRQLTQIRVVTISAAFGAGGSVVGPAVAEKLGLPFLDRALPVAVSQTLDSTVEDAFAHDERPPTLLQRVFKGMAGSVGVWGVNAPPEATITDDEAFCAATAKVLRSLADTTGGVVLGRAGAIVLAGHPAAFHVRLDGARAVRVARAAEQVNGDMEAAARLLDESDRAREGYVRYFYKVDARDSRFYHLILDSTVIPLDVCADLVVTAARSSSLLGAT
jgi:cytidylate kinase